MKIGIVGPFNPATIADILTEKDIPTINTAATAVNTLVREFLNQGHEVKIYTLTTLIPQEYKVLKGKNIEVNMIPIGLLPRRFGYHQMVIAPFILPGRIAKVVKRDIHKLDVLHAHWTYEYAKAASHFSGVLPVFDTVRDWCPYQMTVQKTMRDKLDWKLKNVIFRQVMNDSRITFIANSSYTFKMITEAYPEKDVPVIPNPIDKSWIVETKQQRDEYQFVSIATGLLSPRKNIGSLLDAFAMYRQQHPSATLHLVGDYNENDNLFQQWKTDGKLEGVRLYGALPHDELASLLDKMSCLIHPSLEETFGNILLEAMSRCVPCIGGEKAGAVPDVLGHGRYGIVCDVTSAQSIFEAMQEVSLPEKIAEIQLAATAMLKENFSSDIIAKKHIELFEKTIRRKKKDK